MLLLILNPIAVLVVSGECIWYDKCGDDPEFNDGAHELNCIYKGPGSTYSARNLEMAIRFSLKSLPSERFHRPEMSQIKAEISLRTNMKLNFHKNVGCQ